VGASLGSDDSTVIEDDDGDGGDGMRFGGCGRFLILRADLQISPNSIAAT
jgi:hypothetical protein